MNKYVLIKRTGDNLGLFSYVITNIGAVNEIINNNQIPIIDMQSYKNPYIDNSEINKINAWELYFEQPCNISITDINTSDCNIYDKICSDRPNDSMKFFMNKDINTRWRNVAKKYLRLNSETKKIIETYEHKYFNDSDRVLGVLCRGTDYINLKPKGHPIQPKINEVIKKARKVMKKYNCNKIFLATEDENVLNEFKNVFKDTLLYHNQKRFSNTGDKFLAEISFNRKNDNYLRGLDYLISIVLLSKCTCFVGGVTSGTVGVELFNPNFEYRYLFNKGRYGLPFFVKHYYIQK